MILINNGRQFSDKTAADQNMKVFLQILLLQNNPWQQGKKPLLP